MSLDIPSNMEQEIEQFAQQQQITPDEAIIRLIECGLSYGKPAQNSSPASGLGLFGNKEDAAILDDAVALAYEERRRPSKFDTTH